MTEAPSDVRGKQDVTCWWHSLYTRGGWRPPAIDCLSGRADRAAAAKQGGRRRTAGLRKVRTPQGKVVGNAHPR